MSPVPVWMTHLDVPIAGYIGKGVGHAVMRLPVPLQRAAVGVALHEEDALVAQLELVVLVTVLVLRITRPLDHPIPLDTMTGLYRPVSIERN